MTKCHNIVLVNYFFYECRLPSKIHVALQTTFERFAFYISKDRQVAFSNISKKHIPIII